MYYAQITNGIVTAVSELAGEINAANMVQIDGLDPSLLGKAYEAGEFVDVVQPVVADPCEWLVDTGPWKDRFDTFGYPGLRGIVLALGRPTTPATPQMPTWWAVNMSTSKTDARSCLRCLRPLPPW